jgi:hypothetical protein
MQHAVARLARVADGDQHRVGEQEVQRPRAELAVPADEPVLTDRALERRHARDQQHDDHHRVRGEETGQAAERDRDAAGRAQRAGALGGHLEPDRHAEPDPGRGGQEVDDHGALARRSQPSGGGPVGPERGPGGLEHLGHARQLRRPR